MRRRSILLAALTRSEDPAAWTLEEWDALVRQARAAGLLARVALLLQDASVPDVVRPHFAAILALAEKHVRDVRRELRALEELLAPLGLEAVLLKGAAYVAAGLPPAPGRLFSDIDFMVPIERLDEVERTLRLEGYQMMTKSAYDERYYRRWAHQLPPLRHYARGTVIDVHHTVTQRTSRFAVEAPQLFADARPVAGSAFWRVLAPADMTLHSATHLFAEGEFDRSLRDLVDVTLLLEHFAAQEDFVPVLAARARELGLGRLLWYAARYSELFLGSSIEQILNVILIEHRT